jgi:hypothetical protein
VDLAGRCVGFGTAVAAIAAPILFVVVASFLLLLRLHQLGDNVHIIKVRVKPLDSLRLCHITPHSAHFAHRIERTCTQCPTTANTFPLPLLIRRAVLFVPAAHQDHT